MDDHSFEPRLGRMRTSRSPRGRKYLHSVLASAARAGLQTKRKRLTFTGARLGRGAVAARLAGAPGRHHQRRAIVKTRLVRLSAKGIGAARAHLRYLQRDAVAADGERDSLYSGTEDRADGRRFLERSAGDRHQFRLIVSAEDGAQYDDLKPLVRRFMAKMEEDLGTRLEWVAADHSDTAHPHSHIILRGRDERGGNLVIAPDYIAHGMRNRLAELVSLDLGPVTEREMAHRRRIEINAERLTALDRRLLRETRPDHIVSADARGALDRALRTGRLRKLAALGLAEAVGGGRWRLAHDLEGQLRRLGERGDIIRTMQRALKAAAVDRGAADHVIHAAGTPVDLVGRLIERGLADEAADRHYLIVDATDGRTHYVGIGKGEHVAPMPAGAIIRIKARRTDARESDRRIAAIARAHEGRYSIALHRALDPAVSPGFAQAHVRRLEAIRRHMGGVERHDDGSWTIPSDYERLAKRYERQQARLAPVDVGLLSPLPLQQLAAHDGATWLDRELASPSIQPRDQGFGREIRSAMALRRAWLLDQGLALDAGGQFRCRPDMVAVLQRRELLRVAARISQATGLSHLEVETGARIGGTVRQRLDLASGRFAVIDNGREFSLVPWRPVLERSLGRDVRGIAGIGGRISWTIGKDRGRDV